MATADNVNYGKDVRPETATEGWPARSPFAPIANYGFLLNCRTGALVAPDGTVDWLCVPSFDSPSVFGAPLDRGAGGFRFAPFGINVPSDRIYEPGTNSLVTTWKMATGALTLVYVEILQQTPSAEADTRPDDERQWFGLERLRRLRAETQIVADVSRVVAPTVRRGLHGFAAGRGADMIVIGAG